MAVIREGQTSDIPSTDLSFSATCSTHCIGRLGWTMLSGGNFLIEDDASRSSFGSYGSCGQPSHSDYKALRNIQTDKSMIMEVT